MRRHLGFASLVIALAFPMSAARGQEQVIGFEAMNAQTVLDGYAGFAWSTGLHEWALFTSGPFARPSSGLANAVSDEGSTLMFSKPGELFDLTSMFLGEYLSGPPDRTEINSTIVGLRDGQVVYSMDMIYDRTAMTEVDFNWTNIDAVSFGPIKGRILVDDISVTSTPEPATIALVASGMLSLVVVRRRKSKGNAIA
ncbi:MAG TPA: PEP-CTERM sorting domain-containing protein [Gemmatimonadaceae bacterium]|nr:PEP-CTERM sorting domain-containing protein [Gemmatimonadaceae bacterium]